MILFMRKAGEMERPVWPLGRIRTHFSSQLTRENNGRDLKVPSE